MKIHLKPSLILLATIVASFGLRLPAQALTVSPPIFDYTLDPGHSIRDIIKLHNEEEFEITLYPQVYNFTFVEGDETSGTPDFYDRDEVRNGHELAPWITVSEEPITLKPGERHNLDMFIFVPEDGSPGSHFGSVQFHNRPGESDGSAIGLVGGTGVLIFARVTGEVRDELGVSTFSATRNSYTSLPADFIMRLENRGNTHLRPAGNIFIKNMFGRQVASLQANKDFRSILPESARRFEASWSKRSLNDDASEFTKQWSNLAFGKYEATLVLTYGDQDDQKLVTATTAFWVFPWMVILTITGVFLVLILLLALIMKQYNKALIRRHEARKKIGNA